MTSKRPLTEIFSGIPRAFINFFLLERLSLHPTKFKLYKSNLEIYLRLSESCKETQADSIHFNIIFLSIPSTPNFLN